MRRDTLWIIRNGTIQPVENLPLLLPANDSIVFGDGTYGIRDSGGTLQYKNQGGTYAPFGSGGGSGSYLSKITSTSAQSANFTASPNVKYVVDTTSGNVAAALPSTNTQGDIIFLQKSDASANILNITGKINGTAASTLPIRTQQQGKLLQADGAGNWEVIAGDLSLPSLDKRYETKNTYNVKDYGALGNGTTDDTTAINSALTAANTAGGGKVLMPVGNYLISSPLIIYSNTLLYSVGATITLASGSNTNMIRNAGVTPVRTVTDGAITTGTATLTSATANFTSADVGRSVNVNGAHFGGYVLTATILTVNSTTSVTLNTNAGATVSGATVNIYNRNTYIEIHGGYWNRGSNGYVGGVGNIANQTTLFRHIDNIYIHDLTVAATARAYQLSLADVTNYVVRNITSVAPNTVVNTDAVNIHAPAQYGLIDNIYGTCGDDLVSVHSLDGDGNLQDTVGDITDLVVTNLYPNQNGQAAFKAHAGGGTKIRSLTVRGVHGSSLTGGIHLQDYAVLNGLASDSDMGDIVVEDVDCLTAATVGLINIYNNNPVGQFIFRDIVFRQPTSSNVSVIYVGPGTTIDNITVDGLTVEGANNVDPIKIEGSSTLSTVVNSVNVSRVMELSSASTIASVVSLNEAHVTINSVSINDVTAFKNTNAQNALLFNRGATLNTLRINNVYLKNGGMLIETRTGSSALSAVISNVVTDAAYSLGKISSTVDMTITNLDVVSLNQTSMFSLIGTGAVMTVRGKGLINPTNVAAFTRDGTQTPRFVHPEMLADVTQLANNAGDEVYNTNSGANTGVGRVIANGTYWQNRINGLTYPANSGSYNTNTLTVASLSGVLKATSGLVSVATAGTDYLVPAAAFTTGSVPFANASGQLAQDNNNLFWDSTNTRLGLLATAAPTHTLTLGSTANGIALYNTSDQTTNYERMIMSWSGNAVQLQTSAGGTGTVRSFNIYAGPSNRIQVRPNLDQFGTLNIDPTLSGASSATTMNMAGNWTLSAGTAIGLSIKPTINETGTSSYTAFLVNPTETATGSGTKLLADLQVGGSSKFSVTNTGVVVASGSITSGGGLTANGAIASNTNANNSNFFVVGGSGASSQTNAQYLFGGATNVFARSLFYGNSSTTLTTGVSYAAVDIGSAPITTFTSGTHAWLANTVVNPLGTVTSGGATIANTATLYVNGAGTATVTGKNYSTYITDGNNYIGGGLGFKRTTVADAAYTVLLTDYLIAYTSLTAGRTVTLPSAASAVNQYFIVKDEAGTAGTNNITISGTIDGAASKVINTNYGYYKVYSNGTAYFSTS